MEEVVDARGTKRTCQSSQCGARFYDLNRDPIVCPICQTPYVIASAPPSRRDVAVAEKPKQEEVVEAKTEDDVELVSLEDAEVDVDVDDDADDTFLEEDEDEDDSVGVIVGGDEDEET